MLRTNTNVRVYDRYEVRASTWWAHACACVRARIYAAPGRHIAIGSTPHGSKGFTDGVRPYARSRGSHTAGHDLLACHSPDLLSSSSHGWSMIQRAVYNFPLCTISSRHIGSFFPRAPLIQEGRSLRRTAPLAPASPLVRPPCFTLTSRYPSPYEADNHLLIEKMLPDVGGRCEFRKLDLDIVIARYSRGLRSNLILLEKYSWRLKVNRGKKSNWEDSSEIMHSRRLKDKCEKESTWERWKETFTSILKSPNIQRKHMYIVAFAVSKNNDDKKYFKRTRIRWTNN